MLDYNAHNALYQNINTKLKQKVQGMHTIFNKKIHFYCIFFITEHKRGCAWIMREGEQKPFWVHISISNFKNSELFYIIGKRFIHANIIYQFIITKISKCFVFIHFSNKLWIHKLLHVIQLFYSFEKIKDFLKDQYDKKKWCDNIKIWHMDAHLTISISLMCQCVFCVTS